MGDFIHEFNLPISTDRLNVTIGEFLTQLDAVTDQSNRKMIHAPMLVNNTQVGKGFGLSKYPTARLEIVRPKIEILPEGEQINLFFRLDIHLLFQFSPRDDEDSDVNIQQWGFGFASWVWNWITPKLEDNPNGMVAKYPGAWRWDEKTRSEDSVGRSVDRLGPEVTKMSGSLWVTTLGCPLRINNPLVPYPIPS